MEPTTPASDTLERLLMYVEQNDRVCPMPVHWNELWEMLPDRRLVGSNWDPPLPLILGAWYHSPDTAKRARLRQHLEYAADHGVVHEVARYLGALGEADWYHTGE